MTYIETLNMIKNLAAEQPMVNSAAIGAVYKILARPDIKYPIVTTDITGMNTTFYDDREPVNTYTTYIWYVDRTKQDNTDVKTIQSDAVLTLHALINDIFEATGISADFSINVFEQKFSDYCAGAELQVNINVYNELGECSDLLGEIEDEPTLLITESGTYGVDDYKKVIVNVPSVTTEEITQDEYDALTEYDPYKIYLITE